MVSVPCPLRKCDQVHEVRLDRSGNPFVACKTWRNSVWFRGAIGESYLNGADGGRVIHANPSEEPIEARPLTVQEERAARAGLVSDPLVCAQCRAVVELGAPLCPAGHELDWPGEKNSGTPLQRAEGRVESDVQRLLRKIEREANET